MGLNHSAIPVRVVVTLGVEKYIDDTVLSRTQEWSYFFTRASSGLVPGLYTSHQP